MFRPHRQFAPRAALSQVGELPAHMLSAGRVQALVPAAQQRRSQPVCLLGGGNISLVKPRVTSWRGLFRPKQRPPAEGRSGSRHTGRLALTALGGAAAAIAVRRRRRPLPVVLVHGILDSAGNMEEAAGWVREALGPGSYVRCIEIGNGEVDSLIMPMNQQLSQLAAQLQADVRLRRGFNMIGYSQGSLLARGFVQRYGTPRVHTLISWVGPQAGQYGCPDWEANWPDLAASTVIAINQLTSAVWYSDASQARLSF
jgi:pimeloyl-ACP methyl ester carboxylesterase